MEDFFARFRTGGDARKQQDFQAKLQKAWDAVLYECQLESNWTKQVQMTEIPQHLQRMADVLVKEQMNSSKDAKLDNNEYSMATGGCMELFLDNDMLADLIRISEEDVPLGFRSEVIHFLASLMSYLDGKFLTHTSVHRPALHLIQRHSKGSNLYDEDMLELEYNISSKIKDYPNLLPIFLKIDEQDGFLLFDHLLRNIHQEGGPGDIARTALMFLMEVKDKDLEVYVASSEFCHLTIAGLGGLYSQLPQSLPKSSRGARAQSFNNDLESFIKLLEFIQTVLIVCPSQVITDSLLVAFKTHFLDNIVACSILSASDFNGSSAAILYYLLKMVESVKELRLSQLLCSFLLSSEDPVTRDEGKDMEETEKGTEMQLCLRDIILSKLNSLSEEVVTISLVLFESLLAHHGRHVLPVLIENLPIHHPTDDSKSESGSLSAHTFTVFKVDARQHYSMIDRYLALLPRGDDQDGSRSLESYLKDAHQYASMYERPFKMGRVHGILETNPRSSSLSKESFMLSSLSKSSLPIGLVSFKESSKHSAWIDLNANDQEIRHNMVQLGRDTTLRKLINKFATYFSHTYEINLALTGMMSQLASAPEPCLYQYIFSADILLPMEPADEDMEERQSLFTVLTKLEKELQARKSQIPNYESQLSHVRSKLYGTTSSFMNLSVGSSRSGLSSLSERRNKRQSIFALADLDLDTEFLKNVVLLEESIKELVAILLIHSFKEYDAIAFI